MPDPQVGEKFLIQIRRRRNKPSATFTIEVATLYDRPVYRVRGVKYPSNTNNERNLNRSFRTFYWYEDNPPSWWDSGSWQRLLVKAVKDRRERMDRALRPTT
jgi:hypothetical protein